METTKLTALKKTVGDIENFVQTNRENIDESLVSMRIMKQVEELMDSLELNKKQLAKELGFSQAHITNLFIGNKNVNMKFISRIEKRFNVIVDIKIQAKDFVKKSQDNSVHIIQFNLNNVSTGDKICGTVNNQSQFIRMSHC